jgi:hypothetical protein
VPLLAWPGAARAAGPAADRAADRAVFEARCALCHGSDGRGAPGRAAFDLPLPDFTDCSFASREADADWLAVIRQGGPARGFSPVMPPHAAALSAAEIAAVLRHLRRFCEDARWPPGELNLPRPLVTEKAFPEDEALVETFVDTNRDGRVATELLFEKRIGPRSQVEIALPFVALERPERPGSWNAGIGDLVLAAKHAFFHSGERGSIASLGAEVVLPTGDEDRGLGGGTTVFEPYLAVGQLLPGGAFLQLQALGELPVDRDRADEVQLRATLGRTWRIGRYGRAVSPMVEAVGVWAFEPDGTVEQWELVPQVQIALSRRQHVRLNLGARIPITDAGERPTRFGIYLLWDWFDGGLLEGW